MFERTAVDHHDRSRQRKHPVMITLDDGTAASGHILSSATRDLEDEVNSAAPFLSFETVKGKRSLLAKSAIRSIESMQIKRADRLERALHHVGGNEPHAVLGVACDADRNAIRSAYLRLMKLYHPDRYSGTDLPREIADYLDQVVARINLAYQMLAASSPESPQTEMPPRSHNEPPPREQASRFAGSGAFRA